MTAYSLTRRLALFFTGVAAAIVLGLGALFSWAAQQHCLELDTATLQDKQHLIEEIVQQAPSPQQAQQRLDWALGHHHGLFVHITFANGETLFKTAGFLAPQPQAVPDSSAQKTLLAEPHPAHSARNTQNAPPSPPLHIGRAEDGRSLRYVHFPFTAAFADPQPLQVTLVVDAAHHAHFLQALLQQMGYYALGAIALSGFLGWLAAHQGLAPLRAMKKQAAGVTGQQLHPRMPMQAVPIEMAELASELNGMLDRLQQDFNRLQDFSSDLAHELRTPLSNLLTQTQVILSAPREPATYCEALASNAEEFQRLGRMVQDMLFLAKTEHGQGLPKMEPFQAEVEIQALLDFYEALAEERHIHLQTEGRAPLLGNPLLFRRALSNLLANAFAHTLEGGQITLKVIQHSHRTQIHVSNTGPTIAPEQLPRLFDRFYRADPSRQHALSEGAGLGLAITKAIVHAHGGTVAVTSERGLTCFTLAFPVSAP